MRERVRERIVEALSAARAAGDLSGEEVPDFTVEAPRDPAHGDLATNLAFLLAPIARNAPARIAEILARHLVLDGAPLASAEVAGKGFLNLRLGPAALIDVLGRIEAAGESYGRSSRGEGRRAMVEFVSANPTGPLHVGHGRGAAVGDAIANLLEAVGYEVTREYYVNDAGNQMRTLGRSVHLRARQERGEDVAYPETCYQGDYVGEIARALVEAGDGPGSDPDPGDDALDDLGREAGGRILAGIREDLEALGVTFDVWTHEASFNQGADDDGVGSALAELAGRGVVRSKEGEGAALWFLTTEHSDDDKDRVVVKSDGTRTYFAADIAYHKAKVDRGFDRIVDVWGRDHGGYVERMRAAMRVLGASDDVFSVVLVHLVNLLRGGEKVQMSTRRAEYVTLREVVEEVSPDVARFIFLTRSHESSLDFDLDLAVSQASDNPVYYVQYMHTRCCGIERKAREEGIELPPAAAVVGELIEPEERQIVLALEAFPSVVETAAETLEPHRISTWLQDLARAFSSYYTRGRRDPDVRVLGGDPAKQPARLLLVRMVRLVSERALTMLGVDAPERM